MGRVLGPALRPAPRPRRPRRGSLRTGGGFVAHRSPRRPSALALAAAGVAFATDLLYIALIVAQGDVHDLGRVVLVAGAIAAAGAAAAVGAVVRAARARALVLTGAAATLVVWGAVGAFSIGAFLLFAGVLAAAAAVRGPRIGAGAAVAASLIAMSVLALSVIALAVT